MLERAKKNTKWLGASVYGHFSLWAYSMRTILMTMFILLMTYMLVRSMENSISVNHFDVHMGGVLFSYAYEGFNMIMTSVAFLVMMSEIPKRVSCQNYTILRLSRGKWLISLVAFCISIVFVFIILMFAFSAILSLSFVKPGTGWSDLERLALDENYIYELQFVETYIRMLDPTVACALAASIIFLFWSTLAFLVLLFSLWNMQNFGVVFCVSLLLLNITILFENLPGIKLPSHFATLSAVSSQVYEHKFGFIAKVISGYLLLDTVLLLLMATRVRRMDIQFVGKE
ncbi:MAG: hypothetical protein ACI3W5_01020 [Faecousia sp.]